MSEFESGNDSENFNSGAAHRTGDPHSRNVALAGAIITADSRRFGAVSDYDSKGYRMEVESNINERGGRNNINALSIN